ncbi:MAG: hypothetical protein JW860_08560 [Sedimentisphaerales bacterium]|nr:hypothetical protein [Sedimentisphaerales bacterium]
MNTQVNNSQCKKSKVSSLAIWVLVLALLSSPLLLIFALESARSGEGAWVSATMAGILVLLEIIALIRINRSKGLLTGQGAAVVAFFITLTVGVFSIYANFTHLRFLHHVQCFSVLCDVCDALEKYQSDHQGNYPPDLITLTEGNYLDGSSMRGSEDINSYLINQYRYHGADLPKNSPPDMILVYDKFGTHEDRYRDVLFTNGNIEIMSERVFHKGLARDNELREKMGLSISTDDHK